VTPAYELLMDAGSQAQAVGERSRLGAMETAANAPAPGLPGGQGGWVSASGRRFRPITPSWHRIDRCRLDDDQPVS
jgi:hypothetical protein